MIDNLVSNHLLPAYKQNRAHSRHYRSEYIRSYLVPFQMQNVHLL